MDDKDLFLQSISFASGIVAQVNPEDLGKPTPDTDWNVRALLNHILYELAWTADIAAGKTIAEVGDAYDGDLIGEDLQAAWAHHLDRAQQGVLDADPATTAHLSYADVPLSDYLQQAAADQLIHAWDLGTAIGVDVVMPPTLVGPIYDLTIPRQPDMAASGLFAARVPVADDEPLQVRLLALYGRDARA